MKKTHFWQTDVPIGAQFFKTCLPKWHTVLLMQSDPSYIIGAPGVSSFLHTHTHTRAHTTTIRPLTHAKGDNKQIYPQDRSK